MGDYKNLPVSGTPESLANAVYKTLRDAIADGVLAPGSRLREVHLARQFGVSTTPVREALGRLTREGVVSDVPYKGAAVATFDRGEITHLYELREVLERHALRAATLADQDLVPAERLLAAAERALDEPDQVEFNRIGVEFHRYLTGLAGNSPLAEIAVQVHRRIQGVRVRCAVYLPGRPRISHAQHLEILSAIRQHDADRAEAVLSEHIASVRDAVVRVLEEQAR